MSTLNFEDLNKSRVRISLENNILDWEKYSDWYTQQLGCSSLQGKISEAQLASMKNQVSTALQTHSEYDFWNEDLMPFQTWDGHLIVLGIHYQDELVKIPNCIFILTEPLILSYLVDAVSVDALRKNLENIETDSQELAGIDFNTSVPNINFGKESVTKNDANSEVWDYLSERHDEYSFEAKKQFSGYIVLKIKSNKTTVFKMDPDLEKSNISNVTFEYDLQEENPFKKVFESGLSESFNINQMSKPIQNFKYICITALKRGSQTVGFLVGLQLKQLAENDQLLLEDLAKESA